MKSKQLTQERLKELLHYDPETGLFIRLKTLSATAKKGSVAGYTTRGGYRRITINGVRYLAHRLAWLYMKGYLPEYDIDHINRNPGDNRFFNLRHVSRACNTLNSKIRNDNSSGIKGVYLDKRYGGWLVQIRLGGKLYYFGKFNSLEKAVRAKYAAEKKLNILICDTQSTAYSYLKEKGLI